MKLRAHLMLMALAVILPMLVFGLGATLLIADREMDVFRRGALERALALSTAIDSKLQGHVESLEAISRLSSLEDGDLAAFRREVERIRPTQMGWRVVELATPDGERVFETESLSAGQAHVQEQASFDAVKRDLAPAFGRIHRYDVGHLFPLRVPVLVDGELRYVLSALIEPRGILNILEPQRIPESWVGVVLDPERMIVARTRDDENKRGHPASDSLRAALADAAIAADGSSEDWYAGNIIEGTPVYTAFHRSGRTRWTVALGVPRGEVREAVQETASMLIVGTVLAIAAAAILAATLIRRIVRPIDQLAEMARRVPEGVLASPQPTRVAEVGAVGHALVEAAASVRARERALLEADAAKDEFLAMLGHELRNPLSALAAATSLMDAALRESTAGNGSEAAAVAVMKRQVEHMTRLVDDLLDVSRVTKGKINLVRKPLDLAAAVEATMRDLETAGRFHAHRVTWNTEPVWIDADAARVEQVLFNLVSNAVKYTPPGGTIAVRVRADGDDAVLEVEDDGIGLEPDLAVRVFDLFVQDERSLDRSLGGLGIGLTLVKALVERHGGAVTVFSAGKGKGALFTVRLPGIAERPASPEAPPVLVASNGPPMSLLLVEDNDDARATLAMSLTRMGHRVHEAEDGRQGFTMAVSKRLDAAIVDVGLPVIDGFELAERIRRDPRSRGLVLVAVTGYGEESTRRRAFEVGFDDFLRKPVTAELLLERLARLRRPT